MEEYWALWLTIEEQLLSLSINIDWDQTWRKEPNQCKAVPSSPRPCSWPSTMTDGINGCWEKNKDGCYINFYLQFPPFCFLPFCFVCTLLRNWPLQVRLRTTGRSRKHLLGILEWLLPLFLVGCIFFWNLSHGIIIISFSFSCFYGFSFSICSFDGESALYDPE